MKCLIIKSQFDFVIIIIKISMTIYRLIFRRKHHFGWCNNLLTVNEGHRLHFQTEKDWGAPVDSRLNMNQVSPHCKGATAVK